MLKRTRNIVVTLALAATTAGGLGGGPASAATPSCTKNAITAT